MCQITVSFLRCNEGRVGRECECSSNDVATEDMDQTCRKDNATDICSNNGDCVCGRCECKNRENPEERYSGKFCECDNFSCDRSSNKLCGGECRPSRCTSMSVGERIAFNCFWFQGMDAASAGFASVIHCGLEVPVIALWTTPHAWPAISRSATAEAHVTAAPASAPTPNSRVPPVRSALPVQECVLNTSK